jgi:hypothetical protein
LLGGFLHICTPVHVPYMWPLALWNTTSLFLTWYQSPEFRVPVIAAASSPRHPPVPVLAVALFPVSQPPPRSPRLLVVALFPAAIASIRSARPPPARPIAPRSGPPAGIRSARPHPPGSLLVLVSWRQLHRPPGPPPSAPLDRDPRPDRERPARRSLPGAPRSDRPEPDLLASVAGSPPAPRAKLAHRRPDTLPVISPLGSPAAPWTCSSGSSAPPARLPRIEIGRRILSSVVLVS